MPSKIRTRFAPSPTGSLHIGGARTALFNYIFAKQNKGKFILRIEDTDKERSNEEFEKDILEALKWLDIKYDKIYYQSKRLRIYKKYLKKLLKKECAFWCFHTKKELEKEKKQQIENKKAPRHVCEHKETRNKKQETKDGIIRLRGSNEKIKFNDLIRGEIEYDASLLGDISIAKNENTPLYNFAAAIDDCKMKISHVIRGEDHIPNTPKQILVQKALGFETPNYAHIPLTLGADRTKLSKRHGATSLNKYKGGGYLPEALINFMAFLGWNPGDDREVLSKKELLEQFSLEKMQKGGAIFNIDKLNWFNKEYIKKSSTEKLAKELINCLAEKYKDKAKSEPVFWKKIFDLEKPRLTKLTEINQFARYFFEKPGNNKRLLCWKETDLKETAQHLDKLINLLSNSKLKEFDKNEIKNTIWDYVEQKGRGNVLWPFRVALTGQVKSPDPFSVAEILGRDEVLNRLRFALSLCSEK